PRSSFESALCPTKHSRPVILRNSGINDHVHERVQQRLLGLDDQLSKVSDALFPILGSHAVRQTTPSDHCSGEVCRPVVNHRPISRRPSASQPAAEPLRCMPHVTRRDSTPGSSDRNGRRLNPLVATVAIESTAVRLARTSSLESLRSPRRPL